MRDVTPIVGTSCPGMTFLLTRPMRDVTAGLSTYINQVIISTHTSHAGRDGTGTRTVHNQHNFYSHVPCGT